jgi:hypothetical protein
MPVASGKYWRASFGELINVPVKNWNNLVAVLHRQSTPWAEIALDVDHNQRVFTWPWHRFSL